MESAEIVVRRLRVSAGQPLVAARVEDALRTSSKPAALLHRHVLVRRLRLRAPPGATAAAIARQLERAWREIEARARPIEQAGEADDAVWAPSEAAARAALVVRWVRGEAPPAWFWARIAAPAGEGAWPQRALRLMLAPMGDAAARADGSAPTALRAVLAVLVEGGALHRFVAALAHEEAHRLRDAIARERPGDATSIARRAAVPLTTDHSEAVALAWQVLQARLAPTRWAVIDPVAPASTAMSAEVAPAPAPSRPRGEADARPGAAGSAPSGEGARPSRPTRRRRAAAEPLAAIETPWAGLWLLLPILLREGLEDDDAPLVAFAEALQAAPERFGIAPDDPVRDAIGALDLPWQHLASPWLRRAREAAVRDARLPLRRIAHRRGSVHVSDTRIDVAFPAEAADVRIRRAGFDLDPGFVPWLGRIVRFHYA